MGANATDKLTLETFTDKDEIPLAESMDKFTIQIALVFIAYAMSFLFMKGVNTLLDPTGVGATGLAGTIQGLIWGFQFLFASVFATLLKTVLRRLKQKGVIRREYSNDFLQNRISGFMFDLMVVASIAAIDLRAFTKMEFLMPLSIICVLGAVGSYIYLRVVCKRVFPAYEQEAFLSLYGMQTGTASTGTILLREMDPNFESPAAHNLVYHMPWAIPFAAPMLLMMGMAAESITKCLVALGIIAVLFVAFNILLFRRSIFKKKK
jgi:ESS family glutamate:Na+ symporter